MFNLNFKNTYKVVHINNELGNCVIGGAGTYMNEMYRYRDENTGFIYMNMEPYVTDFNMSDFLEQKDILIMNIDEAHKLENIKCDILVVQFYDFAFYLTESVIKNKKIVYVIHSVPTPEPPMVDDPFGGNFDIQEKFERLCEMADILVCVSNAEKDKLVELYPKYQSKIKVVHNGITFVKSEELNCNYINSRKVFGYIGRTDYRKGILECIKEFRNIDGVLKLACPKNDISYIEKILLYIEATGIQDKVDFCGWCTGERKTAFFDSLDALIIPSLYEPFGYVALEAMQRGLPVISSRNGGLDEILEGYKYKFDPYILGDMENIIKQFIMDSDSEVKDQQQILIKNLGRYTATEMVDKYNRIWTELLMR